MSLSNVINGYSINVTLNGSIDNGKITITL